jgi:hypothetical protein
VAILILRKADGQMNNGQVSIECVYADGSGAPATVKVAGWTYAVDFLGAVRSVLLDKCSSTTPPKWAADHARRLYKDALDRAAPSGWYELNAAMYA